MYLPRSLVAIRQMVSVPALGQISKRGQVSRRILPRNAPALWTHARCMSNTSNMTNEDVLPPKLQKSLNKIIRDEKFKTHSIESRVIPPDGGSFMAIRRAITIKGQTEKGEKELNLYVKTMIPGAELTIYSVPGVYEKETTMYLDVFKVIVELQDEANVPYEDRYYMAKTYEAVDSESIIMEDLTKKGYTVRERMEVMPLNFAEMAIQQLAKLHGMGFIIEARRPEFFQAKVKTLKQPYYYNTEDWNRFVFNVSRMAMTVLDPVARKKVDDYLPTTFAKYSKYMNDPNSVSTFVHNDFRNNNIMVKSNNDQITDVVLIDFQQSFFGSPIIDVLYFIFSGTDQAFRKQHMEHLKNVYHNSMTQYLKYFGLDINSYYTKKEFERLFKERLDFGLMISLWLVPIILADKGGVPDVTKVDLNEMNFKINETVKHRVRGAVDDFIKWGYL